MLKQSQLPQLLLGEQRTAQQETRALGNLFWIAVWNSARQRAEVKGALSKGSGGIQKIREELGSVTKWERFIGKALYKISMAASKETLKSDHLSRLLMIRLVFGGP